MKLSDYKNIDITLISDCEFDQLAKLDDAVDGRILCFIESEKYVDRAIENGNIVAVITAENLVERFIKAGMGVAYSSTPKAAFIQINNSIKLSFSKTSIGSNCMISPNAMVCADGVEIGDNVTIEDGAVIYSGTVIGSNCIIGHNSVIGGDCYERCRDKRGDYLVSIHKGGVIIGNNVIIEREAEIDKALFNWDNTTIGDGCFVGRGASVSHGCKLMQFVTISPKSYLCGNVFVAEHSKIGIGAIVSNRIRIGSNVDIKLGSVVTKNIDNDSVVSGNFAIPHLNHIDFVKKISKH